MPGRPADADVFDHKRSRDGEHIGYIEMTTDGGFVPYDRLWRRCGDPGSIDVAEARLDETGLRFLANSWTLHTSDGSVKVRIAEVHRDHAVVSPVLDDFGTETAGTVDLTQRWTIALPCEDLIEN
ncbi:hypothetical protein HMPREF1531_01079 [Propionibacterium sp. oral taxon 192 str. F0372]|uniref:hypothetical protein n=1 Tax=Propionibacterium sp. oral taxon 192 TaxID=671222 RepID=UPI00035431B3|nr:hypothetical protein [Propionibacterium sp. oral taxon 192]EPH04368.1 hypothetical protein HMPREF1531_01079 [Propionibacterium sp. oral taxon 192 str. F0372]